LEENALSEQDRRTAARVDAILVVELSSEEKGSRQGITRNVSERGLLIATRSKFNPGDRLELTLLAANASPVNVNARVVRVDETPPEQAWRYRVAVELEEAVPGGLIEDGAAAAARLLGRASTAPPPPEQK
jgi:hypothetical protein